MQNPFLVGPRLYLRPLEPEQDSEKVAHWNNDEQMRSYFNIYPTSYTRMRESRFCMPNFGEKCKLVEFATIKWALNSMPKTLIIK